jgi:hypothetical protein
MRGGRLLVGSVGLAMVLVQSVSASGAGLGEEPGQAPGPSKWDFSFTPYGWMTGVNGDFTARGVKANVNESFFDIVDKSDSIMALMGYFEARKGRVGIFTDVVWEDLGFPGRAQSDFQRGRSGNPFAKFPNLNIATDSTLSIKSHAQPDYESTIVQSGAAFEVAKWSSASSQTAIDVLGGARYWNQSADATVTLTGNLVVNATASATFDPREVARRYLQEHGFTLDRRGAKLLERAIQKQFGPSKNVSVTRSATINLDDVVVRSRSGDLEWVDPFIGGRLRHAFGNNQDLTVEADVGGFGAGSQFSWQVVATYGFDVNCLGTPLHTVVGYRVLGVDYTEDGPFGQNTLDFIQHGPVMGVKLHW